MAEMCVGDAPAAGNGNNGTGNNQPFDFFAFFNQSNPRKSGSRGYDSEPMVVGELDLRVRGLPKLYNIKEFEKLCDDRLKLNLVVNATTKQRRNKKYGPASLMLSFKSKEEKEKAKTVLHGFIWKRNKIRVQGSGRTPGPSHRRPLQFKRKMGQSKRVRRTDFASQEEAMLYESMPLGDLSFEDQVKEKTDMAKELLKTLQSFLSDEPGNKPEKLELLDHFQKQADKFDGVPCEFLGVVSPPKNEGYRYRCEFSVGMDENGKKTVGYHVRDYTKKNIVSPIPADLMSLPMKVKEAVWAFQKFVEKSPLDLFNPETHEGHWRMLTVRAGHGTNELLLIFHLHPQNLTAPEIKQIQDDLINYYTIGEGKQCKVTSLYTQCLMQRHMILKTPVEHFYGKEFYTEKLCGLTFRIRPEVPFLANIPLADQLYKAIADFANVNKTTTVLDICCGIGTIGLTLAKDAGEIIGLDIQALYVKEAQENAEQNKIKNCTYVHGSVEVDLDTVVSKAQFSNIVAIIDPPRLGLQLSAITQLRGTPNVSRVVYVAYTPNMALNNFDALCRPTSDVLPGRPFVPVKAVVMDLLPGTEQYELIVSFERLPVSPDAPECKPQV